MATHRRRAGTARPGCRRPRPTLPPPTPSSGTRTAAALAAGAARQPGRHGDLLKGIDRVRDLLVENTERFARGLPANNALLWGARGMGKSSLVKAVHAAVNASQGERPLKLVEIHREDIESLPDLMALMRDDAATASSCSATICPSRPRTRATSRSRRCSKAASKAGPTTSCSTPPRTAAT